MRILIVSNLYPPLAIGGYERACANVAAGLAARGHDVEVLTSWSHLPARPPAGADPPYVKRALDLRWFVPHRHAAPAVDEVQRHEAVISCYANSLRLIEALRAFAPDVVYVWNLMGVGIAGLVDVLNHVRAPWALHLMDCVPGYLHTNAPPFVLDVFAARGAAFWERAGIISMSEHILEETFALTGTAFHQGADIIPGWVDLSAAGPHQPYRRGGVTRFVSAGSVVEHKGIGLLVEAAAILRREGAGPFLIDVFGDGEVARYVDMSRSHGVQDAVRFLGPRPQAELIRAYAAYDAFLFPTWEREPFGFAPVEAAGCGTPPIMTRNCGASERLVDGVHCIKIEREPQTLADSMRRAIEGETDLARLGRDAAALVSQDLSFHSCLSRIERVLEGIPKDWDRSALASPSLALLTFVKHDLSVSLRFG